MLFTVFTPTYNRAKVLRRLYDSLAAQTFSDFEWLIVDDGSNDGTEELIRELARNAPFPIRYFWQENRHKKAAFNRGVREAAGDLFLNIDSDDELLPNALERFAFHWQNIPEAARAGFSAVTGLCQSPEGRELGKRFPTAGSDPWCDSDSLEVYFVHRIHDEKCGFHRTSVLRQFPFPEHIPGLVSEGVVWWAIAAAGWKTRFVNEPVRIYHLAKDGDNLTHQDPFVQAPGIWYFYQTTAPLVLRYLFASPRLVARHFAAAVAWGLMSGESPIKIVFGSRKPGVVAMTACAFPIGAAQALIHAVRRARRRH